MLVKNVKQVTIPKPPSAQQVMNSGKDDRKGGARILVIKTGSGGHNGLMDLIGSIFSFATAGAVLGGLIALFSIAKEGIPARGIDRINKFLDTPLKDLKDNARSVFDKMHKKISSEFGINFNNPDEITPRGIYEKLTSLAKEGGDNARIRIQGLIDELKDSVSNGILSDAFGHIERLIQPFLNLERSSKDVSSDLQNQFDNNLGRYSLIDKVNSLREALSLADSEEKKTKFLQDLFAVLREYTSGGSEYKNLILQTDGYTNLGERLNEAQSKNTFSEIVQNSWEKLLSETRAFLANLEGKVLKVESNAQLPINNFQEEETTKKDDDSPSI
ncbi:MAG: hypothetical protein QNJ31_06745 [Candidatus Caenarcaniphilales bacterium]|nr:hypothetical protein [Candidatus Caenarcaniphilales bacterium]